MNSVNETSLAPATDPVVGPGDCALAIGLPTSLEQLEYECDRPNHEFVRRVLLKRLGVTNAREAWNKGYDRFVASLQAMVGTLTGSTSNESCVQKGKVRVMWNATLPGVAELLKRFPVVSIVCHSPFPLLSRADVLNASEMMDQLVRRSDAETTQEHGVVRALRRHPDIRGATSENALIKVLNLRLDATKKFFHQEVKQPAAGEVVDPLAQFAHAEIAERPTMLSLYEAFPRAVKPPMVIELSDGMHDFEALVANIPERFAGTIEFLVCSGLWFTEALRRRRHSCSAILAGRQLAWFAERLTLYKHGIELLKAQPMAYADAVTAIHQEALRWFRDR